MSFFCSEAEAYLPQETESPAFMLSREQLTKGNTLQRLKRSNIILSLSVRHFVPDEHIRNVVFLKATLG